MIATKSRLILQRAKVKSSYRSSSNNNNIPSSFSETFTPSRIFAGLFLGSAIWYVTKGSSAAKYYNETGRSYREETEVQSKGRHKDAMKKFHLHEEKKGEKSDMDEYD